jgi:hypothetical protein
MNYSICPKCKMRVLPKSDGTCPSCQSIILQKGSKPKSTKRTKKSPAMGSLEQTPSFRAKTKYATRGVDRNRVLSGSRSQFQMTNEQELVRVHVHWGMKVVSVIGVVLFAFQVYFYWRSRFPILGIMPTAFAILAAWVFFLADTKIDADHNEIRITAPHGMYVMQWSEMDFAEIKGQSATLFGKNKAIAYNLLLAGKGKRKFQSYVADMVRRRQIPDGRPDGVGDTQVQKLMKNTKTRGWKLF